MNKKHLRIQTNFEQQDDPSSEINNAQKILDPRERAALMLEKELSMILARNFIDCWMELKNNDGNYILNRKTHKVSNKKSYKYFIPDQEERYPNTQIQGFKYQKERSQSQAYRYLKTQRSTENQEEQYRIKRNKSVRVINQQIQNSRASILKQIVEKLRNAKRLEHDQDEDVNYEVLRRINHLQKVIRNIKDTSRNQINIYKTIEYDNHQYHQNGYKNRELSPQKINSGEEDEFMRQAMQLILSIKSQIKEIKRNGQIMKAELEKSQASQNSQKNRYKNGDDEYIKDMISEGVQANINTNVNQLTLAQIQQKHRKLVEQPSILTKATPITYINGSNLGGSGVQSRESDKCIINQGIKHTIPHQPNIIPAKTNHLHPLNQNGIYGQTRSLINYGVQYKPPSTMILPPPPPHQVSQPQIIHRQPPILHHGPIVTSPPINQIQIRPHHIPFEQPRFQHIKTSKTFQTRNNSYQNSSHSIGISYNQQNRNQHAKNSSIFLQEEIRKNTTLSSYCSSCGRNCGCVRVFPSSQRL